MLQQHWNLPATIRKTHSVLSHERQLFLFLWSAFAVSLDHTLTLQVIEPPEFFQQQIQKRWNP